MPHDHSHRVQVFHATAPTCWWSWGYEAVLNRLRLVYGDAIDVRLVTLAVYEDVDEWLERYGMDETELKDWIRESVDLMDVPLPENMKISDMPKNVLPATYAAFAARRQGPEAGERFYRTMLRRAVVQLEDTTTPEAFGSIAEEAGLDWARLEKDLKDEEGLRAEFEGQREGMPHVPLSFYNLAISDGHNRTVLLDHGFEPADVEEAIDWLAGEPLPKKQPTDVLGYLRTHGPAPLSEVRRVFDLEPKEAEQRLEGLVREGKARTVTLAGAPHWTAS